MRKFFILFFLLNCFFLYAGEENSAEVVEVEDENSLTGIGHNFKYVSKVGELSSKIMGYSVAGVVDDRATNVLNAVMEAYAAYDEIKQAYQDAIAFKDKFSEVKDFSDFDIRNPTDIKNIVENFDKPNFYLVGLDEAVTNLSVSMNKAGESIDDVGEDIDQISEEMSNLGEDQKNSYKMQNNALLVQRYGMNLYSRKNRYSSLMSRKSKILKRKGIYSGMSKTEIAIELRETNAEIDKITLEIAELQAKKNNAFAEIAEAKSALLAKDKSKEDFQNSINDYEKYSEDLNKMQLDVLGVYE